MWIIMTTDLQTFHSIQSNYKPLKCDMFINKLHIVIIDKSQIVGTYTVVWYKKNLLLHITPAWIIFV